MQAAILHTFCTAFDTTGVTVIASASCLLATALLTGAKSSRSLLITCLELRLENCIHSLVQQAERLCQVYLAWHKCTLNSTQHRIDIDIRTRHLGPVGHCNVWQRLSTCTFNQTTLRVWPTGHDHSCCQFLLKSAHKESHICHWQVDAQRANNSSNPCKQ